jgi:hypothetical protein
MGAYGSIGALLPVRFVMVGTFEPRKKSPEGCNFRVTAVGRHDV